MGYMLFSFGLVTGLAYLPTSGGQFSLKWALVGILPWALVVWKREEISLRLRIAPVLVLLAWGLITLAWSPNHFDAIWSAFALLSLLGVILASSTLDDPQPLYGGLGMGIMLGVLCGLYSVNLHTPGELLAILVILYLSYIIVVPSEYSLLALPSLVVIYLTHSRIAWIVLGVTWGHYLTRRLPGSAKFGLLTLGVGALALYCILVDLPPDVLARLHIWRDTARELTWTGHGLGSFYTLIQGSDAYRPENAHSDLLQITFETGYIGGLLAFLSLLTLARGARGHPETPALLALCVLAVLSFPLQTPIGLLLTGTLLGRLVRRDAFLSLPLSRRLEDAMARSAEYERTWEAERCAERVPLLGELSSPGSGSGDSRLFEGLYKERGVREGGE